MGRLIGSAVAALALTVAAGSASAGDWAPFAESNCAWCHGKSGQGFATAPRLAGQKHQYLLTQLRNYNLHKRDNPLSKQYMWPAAADLSAKIDARSAEGLASYFSSIPPKAAKDGDKELSAKGKNIYTFGIPEIQHRVLRRLSRPECRRGQTNSAPGWARVCLFEGAS